MDVILEKFVNELKNICKEKLCAVILYGSKASGEAIEKKSDYNILILINNMIFNDLKNISNVIKKWVKKGNSMPVIFSTDRFKMSSDVFPIEFLDMKENHKVLYGEDILAEIKIGLKNLRHECEYELKSNLLKLRQMYIMNKDNSKMVKNIIVESLTSFLVVFKSILILINSTVPLKKVDALKLLSEKANFNPTVFFDVLRLKESSGYFNKNKLNLLLESYVTEIEKVIDFVDKLEIS